MRKVVLSLFAVVGLALTGCEKARTPEVTSPTPSPATPTPQESKAASTELPAPRQLAPESVYFLRTPQRVESDAGIIGIKRGTQLRKIGENSYQTAEGEKLQLTQDLVTNDLTEAKEILTAEQKSQAALQNRNQPTVQPQAARQAEFKTPTATPYQQATRTYTGPTDRTQTTSALDNSRQPAPTPTRPNMPAPRPTSFGATHSATKKESGYIWKKNAEGQWIIDRPVR